MRREFEGETIFFFANVNPSPSLLVSQALPFHFRNEKVETVVVDDALPSF